MTDFKIEKRFRLLHIVGFTLAALLPLFASGCSRNPPGYTLRPAFSVNVGVVDPDWPKDATKLSLAQQDMLRLRGRPELIRIWWVPSGEIVDKMMVRRLQEDRTVNPSLSWIYLSRNEEVVFADDLRYRIDPLSDQLRTVCELGDPQQVRRVSDPGGRLVEKWIYWNFGRIITFVDGIKTEDDRSLQPLPHYMGN